MRSDFSLKTAPIRFIPTMFLVPKKEMDLGHFRFYFRSHKTRVLLLYKHVNHFKIFEFRNAKLSQEVLPPAYTNHTSLQLHTALTVLTYRSCMWTAVNVPLLLYLYRCEFTTPAKLSLPWPLRSLNTTTEGMTF